MAKKFLSTKKGPKKFSPKAVPFRVDAVRPIPKQEKPVKQMKSK